MIVSSRKIPLSLLALLLVAVSTGLGQVGAQLFGSDMLRWFSPLSGVGYAVWTYVFAFDGRYLIEGRFRRLVMFVVLSAIGFALSLIIFPIPGGAGYRAFMILILSLPSIVELLLGRPFGRSKQPQA